MPDSSILSIPFFAFRCVPFFAMQFLMGSCLVSAPQLRFRQMAHSPGQAAASTARILDPIDSLRKSLNPVRA